MANIVKSARGVSVDFDLLKIKEQIANAPKPTVVQAREDFIDRKFSRRVKKLNRQVAETVTAQAQTSAVDVTPTGKIAPQPVAEQLAPPPAEIVLDTDIDMEEFAEPNAEEPVITPTTPTNRTTRKKVYDNSNP